MRRILICAVTAIVAGVLGVTFPESSRADSPLITLAIKPVLALSPEQAEQTEHCPSCGGLPEYTFLKDSGTAWLICHNCGNEWQFQRIKCPYCGNQDPDTLSYIYAENEGMPPGRFYVCKVCNRYIKTADTLSRKPAILTILQKSMADQLDWEVKNLGYQPGWLK